MAAMLAATAAAPGVAGQTVASAFAECERAVGPAWTYADFLCVYRAGRQNGQLGEARRRLRQLGAGHIEHPWATLVLGHATFEAYESQAISLYELAAAGFVRSREAEGEVIARQNLRNMYHLR